MSKLSDRLPIRLSCEEGWTMDTVDLAQWLKELAQVVEAHSAHLDALRGGYGEQPSVDRRLVEEALTIVLFLDQDYAPLPPGCLTQIIDRLRRALEGGPEGEAR